MEHCPQVVAAHGDFEMVLAQKLSPEVEATVKVSDSSFALSNSLIHSTQSITGSSEPQFIHRLEFFSDLDAPLKNCLSFCVLLKLLEGDSVIKQRISQKCGIWFAMFSIEHTQPQKPFRFSQLSQSSQKHPQAVGGIASHWVVSAQTTLKYCERTHQMLARMDHVTLLPAQVSE